MNEKNIPQGSSPYLNLCRTAKRVSHLIAKDMGFLAMNDQCFIQAKIIDQNFKLSRLYPYKYGSYPSEFFTDF